MNREPIISKSIRPYITLICLGAALVLTGVIAKILVEDNDINGRLIGLGAGLGGATIALGFVGLILQRRKPEVKRQQEIDEKDERNIRIREKSAYDTFLMTLLCLIAAEIVFIFLDEMILCLIIIGVMTIQLFSYLVFLYRNSERL
jgi:uncharacterized membrane protein